MIDKHGEACEKPDLSEGAQLRPNRKFLTWYCELELVDRIENERKACLGAVPNRSAMIRQLLIEALDARLEKTLLNSGLKIDGLEDA